MQSTRASVLRLLLLLVLACGLGYMVLAFDSPRVMRVAIMEDGRSHVVSSQPYDLHTGKESKSTLSVEIQHYLWQNGTFTFELQDACITSLAVRPEGVFSPIPVTVGSEPLCDEVTLDLLPHLTQGLNEIVLDVHSERPQTAVYVSPKLFGAHISSTLACLCIFCALALIFFKLARLAGINMQSDIVLVAGFICYALILHLRPNLFYSNDLPGHLEYIRYMVRGWVHPYDYVGWEYFHPPAYYLLASRFYGLFGASNVIGPLMAVRLFALLLYMIFCFYGVRTLHEHVESRGIAYTIGLLLIVFWPVAPVFATRISNDIAVYAGWSITFYYLARWCRNGRLSDFQWMLALMGVTFLFKTSALVMFGVAGVCSLYMLCSHRLQWHDLRRGKTLLAFAALILGILGDTGRVIYVWLFGGPSSDYLSPGASEVHPLSYFLNFDLSDYVAHPVITFEREPGFLNYFLKTMLYSEQQMGGLTLIPIILNILFLVFLLVTIIMACVSIRPERGRFSALLPFIVGAALPPLGPYVFMLLVHYMFCQNFRFIVPMLIPLVVLYVQGITWASKIPACRPLYWLGIISGAGIAVGGMIMNGWLYTHGQFG